jgi:hypothetical protein
MGTVRKRPVVKFAAMAIVRAVPHRMARAPEVLAMAIVRKMCDATATAPVVPHPRVRELAGRVMAKVPKKSAAMATADVLPEPRVRAINADRATRRAAKVLRLRLATAMRAASGHKARRRATLRRRGCTIIIAVFRAVPAESASRRMCHVPTSVAAIRARRGSMGFVVKVERRAVRSRSRQARESTVGSCVRRVARSSDIASFAIGSAPAVRRAGPASFVRRCRRGPALTGSFPRAACVPTSVRSAMVRVGLANFNVARKVRETEAGSSVRSVMTAGRVRRDRGGATCSN